MTDIAAEAVGRLIDAASAERAAAAADARLRRRQCADAIAPVLEAMRDELQHMPERQDVEAWSTLVRSWTQIHRQNRHSLPRHWRHIDRSVRDAVANGVGGAIVLTDRRDSLDDVLVDFDGLWAEQAADYLAHLTDQVLRWRDAWSERDATRVDLADYTRWLDVTGRQVGFDR